MADSASHRQRPTYKPDITMGNIVSWALVVGGFVYGYSQLNSKVDNIASSIAELKNTDVQLQAQINVIRDLSTTRQIDISTKLTRLETILERQEGKLDARLGGYSPSQRGDKASP